MKLVDEFGKIRKWGTRIEDFGRGMTGLGGLQTTKVRVFSGSKFGPASAGRVITGEKKKKIIIEMGLAETRK